MFHEKITPFLHIFRDGNPSTLRAWRFQLVTDLSTICTSLLPCRNTVKNCAPQVWKGMGAIDFHEFFVNKLYISSVSKGTFLSLRLICMTTLSCLITETEPFSRRDTMRDRTESIFSEEGGIFFFLQL
jgi:hypothetical protein